LQLGSASGFAGAGHLTVMIGTAECSAMRTAPSIPAGIWTPSCMAVRKAGETSAPLASARAQQWHGWWDGLGQLGHSSGMPGMAAQQFGSAGAYVCKTFSVACGWDGLRRLDLAWLAHGTVWLGCCRSAGLGGSGESGGGLRRWRLHGLQLGSAGGFAAAGHLSVMIGTAECSAMRTAPSIPAGIWTPSCMAVRKAGETSDPHPWPQLGHSSGMAGGMG
jgi:uncharacterized protein YaaQ